MCLQVHTFAGLFLRTTRRGAGDRERLSFGRLKHSITMSNKPRSRRGRTVTYNLSSASSRDAFEHGLDYHDNLSGDEHESALMGSSPGGSSSLLDKAQRARSSHFAAFAGGAGDAPPGAHHGYGGGGSLLEGRGSEQQTADLINLCELFQASADRHLVEEVYAGCEFSFDRALESLSALLAGQDSIGGGDAVAAQPQCNGQEPCLVEGVQVECRHAPSQQKLLGQ